MLEILPLTDVYFLLASSVQWPIQSVLEVLGGAEHASGEVWLGGHYHQRGIKSPAASFPKLHYRTQHMSWVCGTFLYQPFSPTLGCNSIS